MGLESPGGVGMAEAVHVDRLDAHSTAVVKAKTGTGSISGILFTMTPGIQGVVLAAHGDDDQINSVSKKNLETGAGKMVEIGAGRWDCLWNT